MAKKSKDDAAGTAGVAPLQGTPETLVTAPWEDTLEARAALFCDRHIGPTKVSPSPRRGDAVAPVSIA